MAVSPLLRKTMVYCLSGAVVLIVLFIIGILTGPSDFAPDQLFRALAHPQPGDEVVRAIILEARLPRAITAMASGAGLALCGMLMQSLFRNPLAGPSVLGITSGASLCVALLVLGQAALAWPAASSGGPAVVAAGILGAAAVLMLVMTASARLGNTTSLLLFGILLGHFVGAVESVLQHRAAATSLRSFVLWGMGRFTETPLPAALFLLVLTLAAFLVARRMAPALNLFMLGETYARSMGMHVRRFRMGVVALTGIVAGSITAWCGPVAFIGLAMPHVARLVLSTSDHRALAWPLAITGAAAGLLSDLLARWGSVPLNAVTSLIGAPIVILIIFRNGSFLRRTP